MFVRTLIGYPQLLRQAAAVPWSRAVLPCAPTLAARGAASATSTESVSSRPMETWEEVELHRPKAPSLEGYVRPAGAPLQADIPREQYHQFMLGKPAKYSVELRNFILGVATVGFCLSEFGFTVYKLKPDDLDWVDEERKRAAAAKERIAAKIAAKEAQAQQEQQ